MELTQDLQHNIALLQDRLPDGDVKTFPFCSQKGKAFALFYMDGVVDKELIGELAVKPLFELAQDATFEQVGHLLAVPELQQGEGLLKAVQTVCEGNAVLLMAGEQRFYVLGLKKPPSRSVAEPPTSIVVKGPREGFVEDIKVNCGLVRKRLKTPSLCVQYLKIGKRSQTDVAIYYLQDVAKQSVVDTILQRLQMVEVDAVVDSSYVGKMLTQNNHSLFKHYATCEKPDVLCAKLCEGRVGILVDGSPIAITLPYMVVEDFQSPEDYYIGNYRASVIRLIRLFAVVIGIFLPAYYISAQLFKIQLIPYKLFTKMASSVAGIPLSPSIEMFVTLFVLEVLNEASIRMPKYVGLTLSVVGALVLGDTAVKAGIISTPAIIIVAFSAICLYAVPDLIETTTMLRWLYLIVAGSVGTFGIIVFTAFLMQYLVEEREYGVPLMAPFAPLVVADMKDTILKTNYFSLTTRPRILRVKNKVRMRKKS